MPSEINQRLGGWNGARYANYFICLHKGRPGEYRAALIDDARKSRRDLTKGTNPRNKPRHYSTNQIRLRKWKGGGRRASGNMQMSPEFVPGFFTGFLGRQRSFRGWKRKRKRKRIFYLQRQMKRNKMVRNATDDEVETKRT